MTAGCIVVPAGIHEPPHSYAPIAGLLHTPLSMRPHFSTIVLVAALIALPVMAGAQQQGAPAGPATTSYRSQVLSHLDAVVTNLASQGFRTDESPFSRTPLFGMLPGEASVMIEVHLEEGVTYLFAGACDENCGDMDLALYDGGELLVQDIEEDAVPVIHVIPARTGYFLLDLTIYSCDDGQCYFGVRVLRK
jgi:hypothetical protein